MAVSRESLMPWWPVVWLTTSALLVLVLLQVESGGFVAVAYLTLNAATVLYVLLGSASWRDRLPTIVGWCAAVQLPTMLWLLTNNRRAPERQQAQQWSHDSQPQPQPQTEPQTEPQADPSS